MKRGWMIIKKVFLSRNCIFNNNGESEGLHGFSENSTDKLVTDVTALNYLY